jgi:O-antigen ligase
LKSRSVSNRDAATASRWSLLPKLNEKILNAPILGNGFGTSVTYQSSDPRIISSTGGAYTTSAFEWGYHDILVKMGLVGIAAYGFLLYAIFIELKSAAPRERTWLIPAFVALLLINFVSPYLNHPLGIGFLALLLALGAHKKREPEPVPAAVTVPLSKRSADQFAVAIQE